MRRAKEGGKVGKSENRDREVKVQSGTRSFQGERSARSVRKKGGQKQEEMTKKMRKR